MLLPGCKDYLDLVPEKDILTTDAIFEKRKEFLNFMNSCYQGMRSTHGSLFNSPGICGSDEFMTGEYVRNSVYSEINNAYIASFKLAEGQQFVSKPLFSIWGGGSSASVNRYVSIRYCNTVITDVDKVYDMLQAEKDQFKAEAKALKAFYYFELMRAYGPIVLVPENIGVESDIEKMQLPRVHVDTCFKEIVKLFDEAIPNLSKSDDLESGRLISMSKEAAYAYKAKVLLYAASPLFNGNQWYSGFVNRDGKALFNTAEDNNKWKLAAEAADEAINYCESVGKKLITGTSSENTPLLNTITDIHESSSMLSYFDSDEYIHEVWLEKAPDELYMRCLRYNTDHNYHRSDVIGALSPSMRMVELFYTNNGLPIEMDRTWPYDNRYQMGKENSSEYKDVINTDKDILNLHLRREPRFYANIAADRCYWKRRSFNVELEPYRNATHGVEDNRVMVDKPQNLTGYWVKKGLPTHVLGFDTSLPPYTVPTIRMADLYLMQAEAWNEFQGPSGKVYTALNMIRSRAGIPDVQDAWSNYSNSPDLVNTKEGLRGIIRQERMIELSFEGHRFWDLRRWKTAHEEMNSDLKEWNVFGEDSKTFYNNYEGPVTVWENNKFSAPRDYFWPIRDEEILISNVVQNPGW